jgi:hypothetical protein
MDVYNVVSVPVAFCGVIDIMTKLAGILMPFIIDYITLQIRFTDL